MVGALYPSILVPLGQEWGTWGSIHSATACSVPLATAPQPAPVRGDRAGDVVGGTPSQERWGMAKAPSCPHAMDIVPPHLPAPCPDGARPSQPAWHGPVTSPSPASPIPGSASHPPPPLSLPPLPVLPFCKWEQGWLAGSWGRAPRSRGQAIVLRRRVARESWCSRMNPAGAAISWCVSSIFRKKTKQNSS